jgi:5'-methylthioadenosine phosphorylase
MTIKIGIIGGSGLDDPQILENYEEKEIETPYGKPSSKITLGKISGVEVCILARHGKSHSIPPSQVNYRANLWALKELGCICILATSAVGSLREEIKPGNLVFPNQFIDFTKQRKMSFFDGNEVVHTSMAEPYDKKSREILCKICEELSFVYNKNKTLVVIEGPRFSTKAESQMFRQLGCDIIGMTGCPEVVLANELQIPYQTIAMSTDYDCWKENEEPVTWEMILKRMKENADKVRQLLLIAIPRIANADAEFIKSRIRTIPNWPKPGIMFRDITTLLKDSEAMNKVIEILYNRYKNNAIDIVAGIEARGFIIGALIANKLNVGFVPIRKKGKLPYEVVKEEYDLEYGKDSIEIHKDAVKNNDRVLIIDDLIATSGTMMASANLIQKLGGKIEECAVIIELDDLQGRKKLEDKGFKLFSIINFKENE